MKRFTTATTVSLVALTMLCFPVGVSATGPPAAQQAAAKKCKPIAAKRNGRSSFISISGTIGCRLARRVAARANGRRYKALGFTCKPGKPSSIGRLYGCSGIINDKAQGIGFFYKRG